jgi:plasmid stabilization system protein ParE
MALSRVEVSSAAREDLADQSRWYFDNAGVEIADRYLGAFDATVKLIAAQPDIGRARRFRDSRLKGLRSFAIQGAFRVHLIFYRVEGDAMLVFRVMHGMRDLPRRLAEQS